MPTSRFEQESLGKESFIYYAFINIIHNTYNTIYTLDNLYIIILDKSVKSRLLLGNNDCSLKYLAADI